jgi:hypothetical protein
VVTAEHPADTQNHIQSHGHTECFLRVERDLFHRLGQELDESLSVLFWITRGDAVNVGAMLEGLGGFGSLLLDPVVRENVDECDEVDLLDRGI